MGEPRDVGSRGGAGTLLLRVLTIAILVVVGVEVGLLGAFLVPKSLVHVPVAPVVAVVANAAVGWLAAQAVGARGGAALPGLGWCLAVFPLSARRPEGDLIVPGTGPGVAFLLLGVVGFAVAFAVAGRPVTRG